VIVSAVVTAREQQQMDTASAAIKRARIASSSRRDTPRQ